MVRFRRADPTPQHMYVTAAMLPVMRRQDDPYGWRSVGWIAQQLNVPKMMVARAFGYAAVEGWVEKKGPKIRLTEAGVKVVDDNKPEEEKRSGVIRASELTSAELAQIKREAGLT